MSGARAPPVILSAPAGTKERRACHENPWLALGMGLPLAPSRDLQKAYNDLEVLCDSELNVAS